MPFLLYILACMPAPETCTHYDGPRATEMLCTQAPGVWALVDTDGRFGVYESVLGTEARCHDGYADHLVRTCVIAESVTVECLAPVRCE